MAVRLLLLLLLAVSWAYWLVAWWCLRAFFRSARRSHDGAFRPNVSILKPVKGVDVDAYANFASFCEQDYHDYELLFAVADPRDPAADVLTRLMHNFPSPNIRLIVGASIAANPKVGLLETLAQQARGDVLVISDSDIRVGKDYLRRVVADLADPGVGMVTCLYRGQSPRSVPAILEALHMAASFAPSVVLAATLTRVRAGLGATMALRRADLLRAGGFAAIADYLADDYELARRIARLGLEICLSDYVVCSVLGAVTFADQWRREVRWLRGIRASCWWGYPGLLLTFSTPIAIIIGPFLGNWMLWAGAVAISLAVRSFTACRMMSYLGDHRAWRSLAMLPARDLLSAALWCAGAAGRTVLWRGQRFRLTPDGRLQQTEHAPSGCLKAAIRRLDTWLSRRQGIYEFSQSPQCVLRISRSLAPREVRLSDGTHLLSGEPFVDMHLWNDRLPRIPPDGPDVAWALAMHRRLRDSLRELAQHIKGHDALRDVKAIRARSTVVSAGQDSRAITGVMGHYGFELLDTCRPRSFLQKCHDLGEELLLWALLWAYNPGGLRGKRMRRQRHELWMSRDMLMHKHGDASAHATAPQPATQPSKAPENPR